MATRDPILKELFDRAYRQLDEGDRQSAKRHEVIVASLKAAEERRERVRKQYAELEHTVISATERFTRSEKIFVDALSEMSIEMRQTRERLDAIGDDTNTHRQTLLRILDRLEERRA